MYKMMAQKYSVLSTLSKYMQIKTDKFSAMWKNIESYFICIICIIRYFFFVFIYSYVVFFPDLCPL